MLDSRRTSEIESNCDRRIVPSPLSSSSFFTPEGSKIIQIKHLKHKITHQDIQIKTIKNTTKTPAKGYVLIIWSSIGGGVLPSLFASTHCHRRAISISGLCCSSRWEKTASRQALLSANRRTRSRSAKWRPKSMYSGRRPGSRARGINPVK